MAAPPPGGIVVVDKPAGWTSHDVVARLRRAFGTRRVGHAGTLDPMATGVLVVGVDWATKLLTYVVGSDKTYAATIRLGLATTTDDAEGEPLAAVDASGVSAAAVAQAVATLTGAISQRPSSVSAIKIDGRRAYARVRAGEDVVLPERPVTVRAFEVLDLRRDGECTDLDVVVTCSTGTYIRALARDLGDLLGVGGHLTVLRRTAVGPWTLAEARTLDEVVADPTTVPLARAAVRLLPVAVVDATAASSLRAGRRVRRVPVAPVPDAPDADPPVPDPPVPDPAAGSLVPGFVVGSSAGGSAAATASPPRGDPPEDTVVAVLDPAGQLVCLARVRGGDLRPEAVVPVA